MTRLGQARTLVLFAAAIMLITSAFHATGYGPLAEALSPAGLGEFFSRGVLGLWLMFSLHLGALALAAGWVALWPGRGTREVLLLVAALLTVDVALLVAYVGAFAGSLLLALGTLGAWVGALRWPRADDAPASTMGPA